MFWGKSARILPALGGDNPIVILSAAIMPQTLWILGISCLVLAVLFLFYHYTLLGKAMRAVADNPYGAQLIGISVRRMVALAFAMSGAMGALAGYGSTLGAVTGGLLLGVLEALGAGFISSAYKDAFAFLVLLAILFLRPAGLFGEESTKRV